jgi:hypothetical protein
VEVLDMPGSVFTGDALDNPDCVDGAFHGAKAWFCRPEASHGLMKNSDEEMLHQLIAACSSGAGE